MVFKMYLRAEDFKFVVEISGVDSAMCCECFAI
jgi:hypothetical protein